jgi:hypothetical protein
MEVKVSFSAGGPPPGHGDGQRPKIVLSGFLAKPNRKKKKMLKRINKSCGLIRNTSLLCSDLGHE